MAQKTALTFFLLDFLNIHSPIFFTKSGLYSLFLNLRLYFSDLSLDSCCCDTDRPQGRRKSIDTLYGKSTKILMLKQW
jgi:hypothetical protein